MKPVASKRSTNFINQFFFERMVQMQVTKRTTSIILSMLMLVSAFTGMIISSNATTPQQLPTGNVKLVIHKHIVENKDGLDVNQYIGNTSLGDSYSDRLLPQTVLNDKNATPVDFNVSFNIYKVGGLDAKIPTNLDDNGYWESIDHNSPANSAENSAYFKATITTGAKNGDITDPAGQATFTAASESEYGLYYVEEVDDQQNNLIQAEGRMKPFFVYLPSTHKEGTGWLTTVNVYPKNIIRQGSIQFTKTFDDKTVDDDGIEFKTNMGNNQGPPKFRFYYDTNGSFTEDKANDDPSTLGLVPIAEITISDITQTQIRELNDIKASVPGINILITETGTPADLYPSFKHMKISEYRGHIAISGLPIHQYVFIEEEGCSASKRGDTKVIHYNNILHSGLKRAKEVKVDTISESHVTKDANNRAKFDDQDKYKVSGTELKFDNRPIPYIRKSAIGTDGKVLNTMDVPTLDDSQKLVNAGLVNTSGCFTFELKASIPNEIEDYNKYEIQDEFKSYFDFNSIITDDITIKYDNGTATEATKENFEITLPKDNNGTLKISPKKPAGLAEMNGKKFLTVTINIRANLDYNENGHKLDDLINRGLKNTATLLTDDDPNPDEDTAYVTIPGIRLRKVDGATNDGLGKAKFDLYNEDGTTKLHVKKLNNGIYTLTPDATDDKITSNTNGNITVCGFGNENYKLQEVEAPNGYQLLTKGFPLNIKKQSIDYLNEEPNETNEKLIKNYKKPKLPTTGGVVTIIFTIVGLALLGGGAVMFFASRKKRKEKM